MKRNRERAPKKEQDDVLVKFLIETQDGKYTELDSAVTDYERLPDYFLSDYEDQAYIFSYS
jgi:hypothetical protein